MKDSIGILRFATAGSVDDGKSTLIGRLLYDSESIFQDQLAAIELSSEKKGFDYVDLSLLTDGLRSEREQGITIDVAYRYFASPKLMSDEYSGSFMPESGTDKASNHTPQALVQMRIKSAELNN